MQISTAVVDLTPTANVSMGGHDNHDRKTLKRHGRLEANVVAIGDASTAVVFVALDCLFAGAPLTRSITAACAARFGIDAGNVVVLASHTHFSPMLDPGKPRLGRADPVELDRWIAAITDAIGTAPTRSASQVRTGHARSEAAVNRRLRWRFPTVTKLAGMAQGDVFMCDNPAGPRDPRIRTCVWLSSEGTPVAAFWSFACHPVAFPEDHTASADYVGVVREALRAHLGSNLPVIFGPGCMGDVRPRSPKAWNSLRRVPSILVYGPSPPRFDRASWDAWAEGLAAEVLAADQSGDTRPLDAAPRAGPMVRVPMDALFDGHSPTDEFHAKTACVPGLGRIVALSCEPVTEVGDLFRSSPEDLVLGYEGDVFGYLPTEAMIAEGGYEPERSLRYFGLEGAFRPGLDESLANIGRSLLDADGTTAPEGAL